ncbi:MAG TPA: CinA family protein [Flavobacteriales bacterium]|nr:CinA family protein [Flavobacteriales bacterium]
MTLLDKNQSIVQEIGEILKAQNKTLSTAESCTGGKISSIITSVASSSDYFKGGIIAYSNEVKINQLGVSSTDIEKGSAVSEKVAGKMAEGIKNKLQTNFAISTTGYAGPKGEKVGQVFIAIASSKKTVVNEYFFEGKRQKIIKQTVTKALALLLGKIKN